MRTLGSAVEQGRIAHAYLFSGPRGTGKTSLAKILAKALNCENGPTAEPDGTCAICLAHPRCDRARRDRDGRRVAPRHRRHPRDPRARRAAAGRGPLQGLHPRRGALAHGRRLERAAEDARGAAAARRVRALHDRSGQAPEHDPLALPALRLPAARAGRARQGALARVRGREDRGARRRAAPRRARGRGLLPRRAHDPRPALDGRRRRRSPSRTPCACSASCRSRRSSTSSTSSRRASRGELLRRIDALAESGQDMHGLLDSLLGHLRLIYLLQHAEALPESEAAAPDRTAELQRQAQSLPPVRDAAHDRPAGHRAARHPRRLRRRACRSRSR